MNYRDIEDLKSFKTDLNPDYDYVDIDNFMDFIYSNDLEQYTEDIKSDEDLKYFVRDDCENSNWQSIKNMLEDIEDCNANYFIMDGYGWLSNVKNRDINNLIDEIVKDYEKKKDDFEL